MPHRTHPYRGFCSTPVPATRSERTARLLPADWHDDPGEVVDGRVVAEVTVQAAVRGADGKPVLRPCGQEATDACQRCGRMFCDLHAPAPELRCAECEEEFTLRARAASYQFERKWMAWPLPAVLAGITLMIVGQRRLGLAVLVGAIVVLCIAGYIMDKRVEPRRRRRLRAEFLAETL